MFTVPIDDVSFERSVVKDRCVSPVPFSSSRAESDHTVTRTATPDTLGRRLFEGYVRNAERQQAGLLTPMVPLPRLDQSELHESIEQLLTCIQNPSKSTPPSTVQCLCTTIDSLLDRARFESNVPSQSEVLYLKSKIAQLEALLENSVPESSFVQNPDELESETELAFISTKPRRIARNILTPSTTSFGSKTQTPMCPVDLQLVSKQLFPPRSELNSTQYQY